ncbi:MFS transporter [Paradevosia shaoguanensis]|uniref:MFS transporter n=1 Tax=Paradevosia shaoguanensis TaxID=1335043 RepID=A0AA41QQ18_9HYPH|nr:MFS transporter [Paradevosia shaoguanensis]MCF1744434.1 MFS transporter [Paradevosia shaoguanensis]MCI0128917.1 MFS transporter [Paradevosia shaoguanensis]
MMNAYAFLRDRRQRWLLACSVPADLADWLDYVAILSLLVFVWGEGPLVLAGFAICLAAPYALIGPWLAVWVDRGEPGRAMFLANLGRAATTALILVAPNVVAVLAIVLLRSAVDSLFAPARQSMIQRVTSDADLGTVNGLHHAINQTAKVVGPGLGGLLLAVMPFNWVIGTNAILSLLAALACLPLVGSALPSLQTKDEQGAGVIEGFAVFTRDRLLLLALLFAAGAFFAFFLYDSQLALVAVLFGLGQGGFALSVASSGAGGVVGALLAGRLAGQRPMPVMILAAMVSGLTTMAVSVWAMLGLPMGLAPFLLILAAIGGTTAMMMVPFRVLMQRRVPQAVMARASATSEAVITAVMLAAPLLGGAISAQWGVAVAMCLGGVLVVLLALATLGGLRFAGERSSEHANA